MYRLMLIWSLAILAQIPENTYAGNVDATTSFLEHLFWYAEPNENCRRETIITTESTCRLAAIRLGISYRFKSSPYSDRPAGCYAIGNTAYLNEITDASITTPKTGIGICGKDQKARGCWKDDIPRALPLLEGSAILNEHYKRRANPIQKCHDAAVEKGYTVFAIQDGGQCFSSADAISKYKKYGESTACSSDGKGGPMANSVYEINPCSEILLDSTGPSGSAHNNWIKENVFGNYRVLYIDADGNALYKKVEPYKNTKRHFFIYKDTTLGTNTWLLHENKYSHMGYLSNTECTDIPNLDQCNGNWKYHENVWLTDNKLKVVCTHWSSRK